MKKTLLSITLMALAGTAFADLNCANYPHWPACSTAGSPTQAYLKKINRLIEKHKNKGDVVLFDWDGTSYDENMPVKPVDASDTLDVGKTFSGEANFHIWGVKEGKFPSLNTGNPMDGVQKIDYFQGKTNIPMTGYNAFSQEATVEAGLTPEKVSSDIAQWLQSYPASANAYKATLDIMQQFKDNGFQVWVITGSNPYFVMNEMNAIDQLSYTDDKNYNLLPAGCDVSNPNLPACQIIGNSAKLKANGRFSAIYNDVFVKRPNNSPDYNYMERYYIDGPGKAVAIRNYLVPKTHKPILFYAGNSGGDYESIVYVLSHNPKALSMAVNPRGSLLDLTDEYGASKGPSQRIFSVTEDATSASAN